MKAASLFAVLTLFAAPFTFGDCIVQNVSIDLIFNPGGFNSGGYLTAQFNPFTVECGTLNSVELVCEISGKRDVTSVNGGYGNNPANAFAWTFTPRVFWMDEIAVNGQQMAYLSGGQAGDPVTLVHADERYDYVTSYEYLNSFSFTDSSDLASFTTGTPESYFRAFFGGYNAYYGGVSGSAEAKWTLTYNYTVPDSATTLALLAPIFMSLAMLRRRSGS